MKEKRTRFSLIRQFSGGYVRYFVLAVVMSTLTTIWNALTPQIFRFTIDNVLDGKAIDTLAVLQKAVNRMGGIPFLKAHLWILAGMIILVTIFSNISTYIGNVSAAKAGEGFTKNMRDTLFEHIQNLPMAWHTKHQTGDMIQRCTSDVNVIRDFVITQLLEVFRVFFLLIVYFGLMFSMNVRLAFIALAFVPVVILYSSVFFDLIARGFTVADEAEGEVSTVVQENATGVRVVRAFGREQFEVDRFNDKIEIFTKLWIRLGTISGLYWGVGDLITGLQVITVIVVGAISAVHGEITVGEFIAFASYNTALQWPIRGLGRIFSSMSKAGVSFDRVNYILSAEAEKSTVHSETAQRYEENEDKSANIQENDKEKAFAQAGNKCSDRVSWNGDIAFSHVSYQYDDMQKVLDDVTFTIQGGTKFGVLGGTGSGKSTLIQLLNRLYELDPESALTSMPKLNQQQSEQKSKLLQDPEQETPSASMPKPNQMHQSELQSKLLQDPEQKSDSAQSVQKQELNPDQTQTQSSGSISIGGTDIREIPTDWLRRNVGMVLQEPYLFSRTIRENIAIAVPDATLEEIREAARLACVDETIMNFPDGYDTLVGERGVTLSGGQRQRIAIARMLLMKTPIMIFDDSLSAVDAATDAMIRQALLENRTGSTLILISHRITTLMGADQILVLHKGQVAELGTHEELLKEEGIYRRVYDLQMNRDDRRLLEEESSMNLDDGRLLEEESNMNLDARRLLEEGEQHA